MKYTTDDFKKAFQNRASGMQGVKGSYSVLVPLVDFHQEAHILYELRSAEIDRQPSEVCFPGGQIEQGESPLQAALREMYEETGIPETDIQIISELDTYRPPSDIVIYPFLGELSPDSLCSLKPNPAEVQECFLVPVSFLLQEPYSYTYSIRPQPGEDFSYERIGISDHTYNWRSMHHQILSWEYQGKYIWGMTAQITKWTLDILQGIRP